MKDTLTFFILEQFPILAEGQVALVRAEIATGHVLDEDLILVIDHHQKIYTVFNTYEDALAVAYEIVRKGTVECIIYGADMEILKYLTA